ncbi:MAG TPA: YaiO family outer membrane beta-barrel protein [Salinimicrobium sp.]|nr:YaiO family outer membrane beta-barrel protein [Salinimicrobium sp.]
MDLKKLFVLYFFCSAFFVQSQEISTNDSDEILRKAIELYKNQDFTTSLQYTQRGLELAPDYHDIRLFQVRNNFALGRLDAVDQDLEYLTNKAPNYPDVKNLVHKRIREENTTAERLRLIEKYEQIYPDDLHFQTLKATTYTETKDFKSAREIALNLFRNANLSDGDRYLLQNILKRTTTDEIAVNYQVVSFQGDYSRKNPWHNMSFEYQHNFNQTAVLARINYSDRSYAQGTYYEIEAYPVFNQKFYGFLNVGFSGDEIFPELRTNASLFFNFADRFEAEGGLRWEKRNETDFITGVIGLTAYVDKFYLNARSYLGPHRNNQFIQNYQFNIRYYLKDPDNYLLFTIGTGISPEEQNIYSVSMENQTLHAIYSNFGFRKSFSYHHIIQLTGGMLFEDISSNKKGTQFIAGVNYRYRF